MALFWPGGLVGAMKCDGRAADTIRARALLVHAQGDHAKGFYEHFNFEPSPSDPYHLLLIMKDLMRSWENDSRAAHPNESRLSHLDRRRAVSTCRYLKSARSPLIGDENAIRALMHSKPPRRSHVHESEAAENGLARGAFERRFPVRVGSSRREDQ